MDMDVFDDNGSIGDMDDLISDLLVEIVQKGRDYVLSIRYSDKYSHDFIECFMGSYKLILSE